MFDPGEFDGKYGVGVVSAVKAFQKFMCLPQTGYADMPTIKALLSSSGDMLAVKLYLVRPASDVRIQMFLGPYTPISYFGAVENACIFIKADLIS